MQSVDPLSYVAAAAAGALLTFVIQYGLRWWQYRRELWLAHVNRLVETLDELADAGTDYWLTPVERSGEDRTAPDKHEARILGLIIRLDGSFEAFLERLSTEDANSIQARLNDLTEALTGGDFKGSHRGAEPDRARAAQQTASEIIVLVTRAVDRALTFGGIWRFVRDRAHRLQRQAGVE